MTQGVLRFSLVILFCLACIPAGANTLVKEMSRVAAEVALLELGFGDYVVGQQLTDNQKETARNNPVKKALEGTYKFRDKELFIIAELKNDIVLGLYKEYRDVPVQTMKSIVGGLMLEHGEPTATAHGKIVYWSYNNNGKIDQDIFDIARPNGGAKSIAAIKLSSSDPLIIEDDHKADELERKQVNDRKTSAFVMITSDPLSKLFLAHTNPANDQDRQ